MNVPKKHRAIAHAWVDGAEIEARATDISGRDWVAVRSPSWYEKWEYRIKPTKPSIDWEHVAPEYVALATDKSGISHIFMRIPAANEDIWWSARTRKGIEVFQSFVKGNCDWKDSLVLRPSAESEEQQ